MDFNLLAIKFAKHPPSKAKNYSYTESLKEVILQ